MEVSGITVTITGSTNITQHKGASTKMRPGPYPATPAQVFSNTAPCFSLTSFTPSLILSLTAQLKRPQRVKLRLAFPMRPREEPGLVLLTRLWLSGYNLRF